MVFGNMTDQVEISIAAGDCSSFLMLLLAGGAYGLLEEEHYLESESEILYPAREKPHADLNKIWKHLSKSLSSIHQVDVKLHSTSLSSSSSSSFSLLSTGSGGSFFDGGEERSSEKNVSVREITLQGSNLEMISSTASNSKSVLHSGFNEDDLSRRDFYVNTNNNINNIDINCNDKNMDSNNNNENKFNCSESYEDYKKNCNNESKSNDSNGIHSSNILSTAISTELSLAIIKDVINVIIAFNTEQKIKNEIFQKKSKIEKKLIPSDTDFKISELEEKSYISLRSKEKYSSLKHFSLAPFSNPGSSDQQKMIPFRPTALWGHFLNVSNHDKNLSTKSKSVNSTIHLLRKLMQNGSAGTVREILRILKDTFGHCCGNISLSLPQSDGEDNEVG